MSTKYSQVKIGELIPFGTEVLNSNNEWENYYLEGEKELHTNHIIEPEHTRFKKNHVDLRTAA